MRPSLLVAAAALLSASLTARADTFVTYYLNAGFTSPSGATITGVLNVDTTDDGAEGTATATGFGGQDGVYTENSQFEPLGNGGVTLYTGTTPPFYGLTISSSTTITGQATVTGVDVSLDRANGQVYTDDDATLTTTPPSAATPEPSSFALLGTGLLGIARLVRKRFA